MHVLLLGQPRRGRVRRPAGVRRVRGRRTRTSGSAAAARTSASAPGWPGSQLRALIGELLDAHPRHRGRRARVRRPATSSASSAPAGACALTRTLCVTAYVLGDLCGDTERVAAGRRPPSTVGVVATITWGADVAAALRPRRRRRCSSRRCSIPIVDLTGRARRRRRRRWSWRSAPVASPSRCTPAACRCAGIELSPHDGRPAARPSPTRPTIDGDDRRHGHHPRRRHVPRSCTWCSTRS